MSSDYITQALGVVGTITGVLALLVSYRTYTNAKPKLKVTVKKCEHYYRFEKNSEKININPQLSISNCGDGGTTLNEIEIQFMQDGKRYKLKKDIVREVMDDDNEILGVAKISMNPHETINEFVYFEGFVKGKWQEKIDCKFKIFHTHGVHSFKAISEISRK